MCAFYRTTSIMICQQPTFEKNAFLLVCIFQLIPIQVNHRFLFGVKNHTGVIDFSIFMFNL